MCRRRVRFPLHRGGCSVNAGSLGKQVWPQVFVLGYCLLCDSLIVPGIAVATWDLACSERESSPCQTLSRSGSQLVGLTESLGPGVSGRFCGYAECLECPPGMCGAWPSSSHSQWKRCLCSFPPTPSPAKGGGFGHECSSEGMCWILMSWLDSPPLGLFAVPFLLLPAGVRRFGELVTHRSQ